jgi:dynein heavy chain, axonemal
MRVSLDQLEKGIKGLVVISPDLEQMMSNLNENIVPKAWSDSYFSLKSLGNWNTDLKARYEFF